ncbi:hypothetical protein SCE1572_45890 [Sorangium cellulosum So0157-2]|uniref:Peptidase M41 FtsH extracellular domain-containing protein n=2 Tax=Sorangium cellulosum TaxID=56 RepID=S4YA36_SORCE|nr:hypothetical protein SCE1572_45890 [Sorangium cellulosum So0157-2]
MFSGVYLVLALVAMWFFQATVAKRLEPPVVPYSEFLSLLQEGRFDEVEIRQTAPGGAVRPAGARRPARLQGA